MTVTVMHLRARKRHRKDEIKAKVRKPSPVKKQSGTKGEAEKPKVGTSPQEEELDIGKL